MRYDRGSQNQDLNGRLGTIRVAAQYAATRVRRLRSAAHQARRQRLRVAAAGGRGIKSHT